MARFFDAERFWKEFMLKTFEKTLLCIAVIPGACLIFHDVVSGTFALGIKLGTMIRGAGT